MVTFFHVSTSASVRGRGQPKDSRLGYPERTRLNSKIDCIVLKWASPCIAAWGPNAGQGRPAAQNSPSAHGVASTRPSQAPPTSAKAFHRSDTPPGLQPAPSRWEAAVGRAAPITRAVRISRTSRGVICPHGPSPLPTSPNRPTRRAPPCHQSNFANIGGSLQRSMSLIDGKAESSHLPFPRPSGMRSCEVWGANGRACTRVHACVHVGGTWTSTSQPSSQSSMWPVAARGEGRGGIVAKRERGLVWNGRRAGVTTPGTHRPSANVRGRQV